MKKQKWLQPARWDVNVLLEDCLEWGSDIARALLKLSGETKVVCRCNILEKFVLVKNKSDHSSLIRWFLSCARFAGDVVCCFGGVFTLTARTMY